MTHAVAGAGRSAADVGAGDEPCQLDADEFGR